MAGNDLCINFLLTTAQHTVFQYFTSCLEKYDVTPAQYGVLNCLWDREYSTPKQISEELCLEMSTISGVLDRMQKKGLIERVVNEKDRRGVRVIATEKGKSIKEPVRQVVQDMNKRVLEHFSVEDAEKFKQNLKIVAEEKF